MNMIPVESSNIKAIGYDEGTLQLVVQFHTGDMYRYFDVPKGIYEKLMLAKSKGQFFSQFIVKAGYKYEKLGQPLQQEDNEMIKLEVELVQKLAKRLERAGLARREQDENGNERIVLIGEHVKEILSK